MRSVDVLIVGQGLAGSVLALSLMRAGFSVLVVDHHHQAASSKVAVGLMNPITGKRYVKAWGRMEDFRRVLSFYRTWEQILGTSFLFAYDMVRLIKDAGEQQTFSKKMLRGDYEGLQPCLAGDNFKTDRVQSHAGDLIFRLPVVYRVDIPEFISAAARYLTKQNILLDAEVVIDDIEIEDAVVRWRDITANNLVFCDGHRAASNPYLADLSFDLAKGEILELESAMLSESRIWHHGKWLLPIGDRRFCYGATAYWDFKDDQADPDRVKQLQQHLSSFLRVSHTVVGVRAGIRPVLKQRLPCYGFSSNEPKVGVLNGLGSQGGLLAPLVAGSFVTEYQKNNCFRWRHFDIRSGQ